MLQIAESLGMLDEIEKLTMFNTFKFISENQNKFTDKKLFINSIPKNLLQRRIISTYLTAMGVV
jgi:EAL domain-containing protein (putative c-di-GMP-specific phosphodiesterase class I)